MDQENLRSMKTVSASTPVPTGRITIGGIQFSGQPNRKSENRDIAERLIRSAVARGAQIVLTPELGLSGYVGGPVGRAMAEPIPGPTTQIFAGLAKELNIYILVGMSEMNNGELMNAQVVIGPTGEIIGVFRKVHINRIETNGGWRNGSEFPVWRITTATGAMTAGIMICYDREVPESARLLMLKGADVIFNPLATTCPTVDIQRCLLRTRAFENELYVFMVNHASPAQNGHSMVLHPDGDIAYEAGGSEEAFVYTVDLDELVAFRRDNHYARHNRRPDLYALLLDPGGQAHPPDANLPKIAHGGMP
jgi:predicted amidohydrolase